jgi:hypothetical protein
MPIVTRVQQGGLQPVRVVTREVRTDALNGRRIHPTGVTITIVDPNGTTLTAVNGVALTFIQTGEFVYYWDTSSLALGDYRAKLRFGYAFASLASGATKIGEKDAILRLVRSI